MEIYINEEKIDFKLEGEKTLTEVFDHIRQWGEKERMILDGFSVNGGPLEHDIENPNRGGKDGLDSIRRLDVRLVLREDYFHAFAGSLRSYLERLRQSLEAKDTYREIDSLKEPVEWIKSSLGKLSELFEIGNRMELLEGVKKLEIAVYRAEERDPKNRDEKELRSCVEVVDELLKGVKRIEVQARLRTLKIHIENFSPDNRKAIAADMKELVRLLGRVAVEIAKNIHTGADREAMFSVQELVTGIQIVFLFFEKIKKMSGLDNASLDGAEEKIDDLYQELSRCLEEVESSLKEKDFVRLGDVVEYELGERLVQTGKILEKLGALDAA